MKFNGDSKKIKARKVEPVGESSDLFTDEPVKTPWEKEAEKEAKAQKDFENEIDYEPAPETEMDFMTEEEEKTKRRNIIIGIVAGLLLASLLIGGFIYHNRSGKIKETSVPTSATSVTVKPGSLEPTENTTRTYVTRQLTVHRDEQGRWRSYAGLEKTVGYTGVVGNDTGWWYVENDFVNFKYNGIAKNDYGEWMIVNGKVNSKYTGDYVYNGKLYHIQEGKVIGTSALTNKPTTTRTTQSTTVSTTATNSSTTAPTTAHVHKWVTVYDGDAIVQTGIRNGSATLCPDCGLIFSNAELLESHAYAMKHNITYDKDGGLASEHILSKEEVGDRDVIIGYTNEENTYWVCTLCGTTTKNIEDTDFGLG